NVIVSASGNIDLRLPIFAAGRVPVLILTTPAGAKRLARQKPPASVGLRAMRSVGGWLAPRAILEEVTRATPGKRVLVEGGPHLLGSFYWERLIDEQFLTLAPQIAGREAGDRRLSLVMGKQFAPRRPLWGTLTDVRLGGSQMFLRYSL
ncbi:MAG TPA: dihydrofolate reductase family protein, partial [Steroidobacteraceae bacterium]